MPTCKQTSIRRKTDHNPPTCPFQFNCQTAYHQKKINQPARAGGSNLPSKWPRRPAPQRLVSGDAVYKHHPNALQQKNDGIQEISFKPLISLSFVTHLGTWIAARPMLMASCRTPPPESRRGAGYFEAARNATTSSSTILTSPANTRVGVPCSSRTSCTGAKTRPVSTLVAADSLYVSAWSLTDCVVASRSLTAATRHIDPSCMAERVVRFLS